jgi:hypothetical protein
MNDERSIDSEFRPTVEMTEAASNGTGEQAEAAARGDAPEASAAEASAAESAGNAPAEDAAAEGEAVPVVAESTDEAPGEVAAATDTAVAEPDAPDFLAQLADAMRATAGAERARIADDIERRRVAQVALIKDGRDAEANRMRELADEDRTAIDTWAETETRRIQAERERRTSELEADLTRSLAEHASQIDGRIQAVEDAIKAHRDEVDAFFTALEAETDPVRIAQQAGRRPTFPDLDAAMASTSATRATVEPVGVMDPIVRLGLSATPEDAARAEDAAALDRMPATAPPSTSPIPSILTPVSARTSGRPEEPTESKPEAEPEPVASSHGQPSGLNPMGWLRRGNDQNDR